MRRARGYTLVELMIAALLGVLLLGVLVVLFVQSRQSFRQNDLVVQMQDQARYALDVLARDLAAAGYWGGMASAADIQLAASLDELSPANDCGPDATTPWAKLVSARVEFLNNATAASIGATWHCIDAATLVAGADAVAVRRVAMVPTAEMDAGAGAVTLRNRHFYLQTNGVVGTLFRLTGGASYVPGAPNVPLLPPMRFYRFLPRIYYLRDHAFDPGDGIPTLCRMELQPETSAGDPTPRMAPECIAVGIQDLQLSWGVDTDNDLLIERWLTAPGAAELAGALAVRIQILARSAQPDGTYLNTKTYTLGDRTVSYSAADGDRFLRRVFTTTVGLKNHAY